jgi:Glu-tRNA(Gln) amidotransferase subunit E-like FAD-binding protein
MTPRIDTLAISKRLTDGGFTREQADVLSATWNEAIDMAVKDLATKQDLLATKDDVTRAIEKVVADQKAMISDQKAAIAEATNKQIVWTVATMLAAIGIVVAITRLF